MYLDDAIPLIARLVGIRVRELKRDFPDAMIVDKGSFGRTLERAIGLNPFSGTTDFVDGELKTNQTKPNGLPAETIAVCVIKTLVRDGLFGPDALPYFDSKVGRKLANMLVCQVVKQGREDDWYIHAVYRVRAGRETQLHERLAQDYETIRREVRLALAAFPEAMLHTTNGRYLQIRTKDARPYQRIFCPHHDRFISEKNFAFYLQKAFMLDVIAGEIPGCERVA